MTKCLHCDQDAKLRGCCRQCYGRVVYRIRVYKDTWAQLEKLGIVLKPGKRGIKAKGFRGVAA